MISETNFKFFIQFCLYTILLSAFVLISTAFFLAQGGEVLEHPAIAAPSADMVADLEPPDDSGKSHLDCHVGFVS